MPNSTLKVGSQIPVGYDVFRIAKVAPAAAAPITPPDSGTVIVYPAGDGFRWHLSRKGRVLCDSGQSYDRVGKAQRIAERIFCGLYPVVTVEAL